MEVIVEDLDGVTHATHGSTDTSSIVEELWCVLINNNLSICSSLSYIVSICDRCSRTETNWITRGSVVEPNRIVCLLCGILEAIGLTYLKSQIRRLVTLNIDRTIRSNTIVSVISCLSTNCYGQGFERSLMLSVEIFSGVCSTRQSGETRTVSKQCVVRLRGKTSERSIGCDTSNDCFRCNACQGSTRCLVNRYGNDTSRYCTDIKTSIEIDCTCCTNCRTRVLNNYTRTSSNNISQLRTITDESCGSDVTGGVNFCSCCKTVSSLSNGCTISSLSCSSGGSSVGNLSSRSSIGSGRRSNDNTRSKTVSSLSNTNCV